MAAKAQAAPKRAPKPKPTKPAPKPVGKTVTPKPEPDRYKRSTSMTGAVAEGMIKTKSNTAKTIFALFLPITLVLDVASAIGKVSQAAGGRGTPKSTKK